MFATVAPYIASINSTCKSIYCRTAIPFYNKNKIRTLTLPFLIEEDLELGEPEDILTQLETIEIRLIDPELYYYLLKFETLQSDFFRNTLSSWGYEPKDTYTIVDINGDTIKLITTGTEIYCCTSWGTAAR